MKVGLKAACAVAVNGFGAVGLATEGAGEWKLGRAVNGAGEGERELALEGFGDVGVGLEGSGDSVSLVDNAEEDKPSGL